MLLIYFLFFLSGISGLVYQVVWVREFGTVFGTTVHSAATVSAVFMAGLGVGGYLAGRWIDRRRDRGETFALRMYGIFEIGIAVFGLALALILPQLEGLSASWARYELGAHGWYYPSASSHLLRFGSAVLLLTPITVLMGGTLTLLIRYLVARDLSLAGWRTGSLYGLNTLGAALGALLSDTALIPNLGIFRTQILAIALNLIAGVAALGLAQRLSARERPSQSGQVRHPPAHPTAQNSRLAFTAAALFCSGTAAMGMEIIWFRHLISALGSYRAVFSLLLVVVLTGIFLGSILGGYLERRNGRAALLYIWTQASFVAVTAVTLYAYDPHATYLIDDALLRDALKDRGLGSLFIGTVFNLERIIAIVGLPAILMGFSFPLANAHVQNIESEVGGRAGTLYLANTLGNVVGSLGTGFLLLPLLGAQRSALGLMTVIALGLLCFYASTRSRTPRPTPPEIPPTSFRVSLALVVALLVAWQSIPSDHLAMRTLPKHMRSDPRLKLLTLREGINENVAVFETPSGRVLFTNGHSMSGTTPYAQRYMRLFSHLPLLSSEDPKRVLVICFGVGTTLHASSLHPASSQLEIVDLSSNVVRHGPLFAASNDNVLDDPRLSVFINDGRQHLRMQERERYDLITLEPPPIALAGVASLYSTEFYELARSRLISGGYLSQWLPAYQTHADRALAMIRSFVDVFPETVLLSGSNRELILLGRKGSAPQLVPARVRAALAASENISSDLEGIQAGSVSQLASTFVSNAENLQRATEGVDPVTDDWPIMEYSSGSRLSSTRMPATIFNVFSLAEWCPECFGTDDGEMWTIPYLQRAAATYYASDYFLFFTIDPVDDRNRWKHLEDLFWKEPCVAAAVRATPYWNELLASALRGVPAAACADEAPGARDADSAGLP